MDRNLKVVAFKRSSAYVHHRAMMNRRENNIVDALELMRRAVEAAPENREYRLDLAELYCEMGCHEQSTRLLLDMLAEDDGPSECYYGLALNQLGMNDLTGARRSLSLYKRRDPEGAHLEEVQRLAAELDFFGELTHPVNRKLHRAACIANRACDAMKADMNDKACRLFERSLGMSPEQYDMRALYAMALLICGRGEEALAQAGDEPLRQCCLGYRAPYVRKTAAMISQGIMPPVFPDSLSTPELLDALMTFPGVGRKVANCVALFGYGRMDAAPVDTWIARVIEEDFGGKAPFDTFPETAGIIQQYLFYTKRADSREHPAS